MKKNIVLSLFALLIAGFSFMSFEAAEPTATEIIKKMDNKFRGNSSQSTMSMKIVRPKWTRAVTIKSWQKGDDYSLILITGPKRDKGVAFLR